MTNTEKFILKESGAKETVIALLKLFDGKSYINAEKPVKKNRRFNCRNKNF